MTVGELRTKAVHELHKHISEGWPGVVSPVEADSSKVLLSGGGNEIDLKNDKRKLSELGYTHNSQLKATVAAPLISNLVVLDPSLVNQPVRDCFEAVLQEQEKQIEAACNAILLKKSKEIKDVKGRLTNATQKNERLASEIKALKTAPDEPPSWFIEFRNRTDEVIHKLEGKIEKLEEENKVLKEENRVLKEENRVSREKIEQLEERNLKLSKTVEDLSAAFDDQGDWISVGSNTQAMANLCSRQVIQLAQTRLAKSANIPDPSSLAWRNALFEVPDEQRIQHARSILVNSTDLAAKAILASPEALRLVTERRSEARVKGNKTAHMKPSRAMLAPFIKDASQETKAGFEVLLTCI